MNTKSELKPGPEMDAAVALAMGLDRPKADYSTDVECAVRDVLPEMIRRWPKSMLSMTWNAGWWYCGRANEDLVHEGRDTLAHAICAAFLEACENAIK